MISKYNSKSEIVLQKTTCRLSGTDLCKGIYREILTDSTYCNLLKINTNLIRYKNMNNDLICIIDIDWITYIKYNNLVIRLTSKKGNKQ